LCKEPTGYLKYLISDLKFCISRFRAATTPLRTQMLDG
jgi:hypothetical protein